MKIVKRIYDDFFRPSREDEYETIIKAAKNHGYEFHTVLSFETIISKGIEKGKKYFINRRDIDTADFDILRKFLEIEKKYGAKATYYFRLSTIDYSLMKEIELQGGEASYHYEEIASFCFKNRVKNKAVVMDNMESIRDEFILNYNLVKHNSGLACRTVSMHGDFTNVSLGIQDGIVVDNRIREATGIVREAYDRKRMDLISFRSADQTDGDNTVKRVLAAIERGEPVIELLTHPRQWNSPIWINLKEEFVRVFKGLYMRL